MSGLLLINHLKKLSYIKDGLWEHAGHYSSKEGDDNSYIGV